MFLNKNLIKAAVIIIMTVAFSFSAAGIGYLDPEIRGIELENRVQRIMDSYVGEKVPGAAVAIVRDGEIIFIKGFGYSDLEERIPVDPYKTAFEYGSVNKLFVWVSAMQLAEQGELDLETDLGEYLPEVLTRELNYDKAVTMLDLMNHTAGFEDPMFNFAEAEMEEFIPLSEVLIDTEPSQIYEPGEVTAYSNYGSMLAAYVIKTIAGENYYKFQKDNIFVPAGIKNISGHPLFTDKPGMPENKARGYIYDSEGSFTEAGWSYIPGYPAGAANGTAEALAKFAISLTPEDPGDSPLFEKGETLERLFTRSYIPEQSMMTVAHGFWEYDGRIKSLGHGGNTAGFTSFFSVSPEKRLGLVVLTNVAEETELIYELQKMVFGKIPVKPEFSGLTEPSSKEVAGSYLPARSPYSNLLEIFTYLSAYKIEDVEDGQIRLAFPGHEARYIQMSPYKYEIIEGSSSLIKYMYSELFFEKEGDQIKKATSGYSVDLLPIDTFRPVFWIYFSIFSFALGTMYFFVFPFTFVFQKIKAGVPWKNWGTAQKIHLLSGITGFIFVINNLLLIRKALANLYFAASPLFIYIAANRVLSIMTVFIFIFLLKNYRRMDNKNERLNALITFCLLLIFNILLIDWNFLRMI